MMHLDLTPGQEGSAEACAILLLLHDYPQGLKVADIRAHLGMADAASALRGLKERGRIKSEGVGVAAVWKLKGLGR